MITNLLGLAFVFAMLAPVSLLAGNPLDFSAPIVRSSGSEWEASAPLNFQSSVLVQVEVQMMTAGMEGLEDCTAQVVLSSDGTSLTFSLTNPSANPLPAHEALAIIRVFDPAAEAAQTFTVRAEIGGVMLILDDM